MSGGMRFDGDDIRAMPLHMQEQVGVAVLAELAKAERRKRLGIVLAAQAHPVAGGEERRVQKVRVRTLRFISKRAAERYLQLKEEDRKGAISCVVGHLNGEHVIYSFSYCVTETY